MAPVLKRIIDELLTAATKGFQVVDSNGCLTRVFIVTVTLMGDLP